MSQSGRQERAELTKVLRAEGRTWVQVAEVMRQRYGVNARAAPRLARGWSQREVADRWCARWQDDPKTFKSISAWERWPESGHEPSLGVLDRLAQLYQCSIADLLSDQPDYQHLDDNGKPHIGQRQTIITRPIAQLDTLGAEADLFDTMELSRLATASDLGVGTVDALAEAVDLLCRAYPVTPAAALLDRSKQRLAYVLGLLGKRLSLDQHRELLVAGGWLAALTGCVHHDLGDREHAETARLAAHQLATEAGHGELAGWANEMAAWFAFGEGRYEAAIDAARRGQSTAGTSSAAVQLALQEAKGLARIGDRRAAERALTHGAKVLDQLPAPAHAEHHFVFDHTKWSFYAAAIYALAGADQPAEEHARQVLTQHVRPDGTSNAPMRVAGARLDLAIVQARRGDLDGALTEGVAAFDYERRSVIDLLRRACDLSATLDHRFPKEPRVNEFRQRLAALGQSLDSLDDPL